MKLTLEFVPVTERLPEIDISAPGYAQHVNCLVRDDEGKVRAAAYARNSYAKTEKGRVPRWQEYNSSALWFGRPITHWAEMPATVGLPQPSTCKTPLFGVLAGEPELIGIRCADGGSCHHMCRAVCSRRTGCVPLTGSGLNDDWSEPK